ncbi:hypothetical protein [Hymenobacter jejuensis]|uniref:Uncharacterized protein n=1 Tax=Hymenobacter jejuensis TaxID=2502781 RepID=A0A5B8A3T3_9BACT|nr:hypothetical protein [Hymenobacter jejuensis]QDA61958.1 hypothetical protein FHG12_18460 [Hymenobacter jejuensis]
MEKRNELNREVSKRYLPTHFAWGFSNAMQLYDPGALLASLSRLLTKPGAASRKAVGGLQGKRQEK